MINYGLGSCSAQTIAAALEYLQISNNLPERFTPSRLFIYFNERWIEGTTGEDDGAMLRDGIKAAVKWGACPEAGLKASSWPYSDDNRFKIKPPAPCYKKALQHRAIKYESVPQDEYSIKYVLAQKIPVAIGFQVMSSFESDEVAKTGIMLMPQPGDQNEGGHAVLCVGYDDSKQVFIIRNSWGLWGDKGYFYMPYTYLLNPELASDFWAIDLVS